MASPLFALWPPAGAAYPALAAAAPHRHYPGRQPPARRKIGLTEPREIYDIGASKLDDVLDWCVDFAIPAVTLWVFSAENFSRPAEEVSGILAAVEAKLYALARDPVIHRRRVRVRAIGRLPLLPQSLVAAIARARRRPRATTAWS